MNINNINRVNGINKGYQQQMDFPKESKLMSKKDQVQISSEAKEMLSTSKMEHAERSRHIQHLKQSVASGTYYVDSGKLAEKLLPYMKGYSGDE